MNPYKIESSQIIQKIQTEEDAGDLGESGLIYLPQAKECLKPAGAGRDRAQTLPQASVEGMALVSDV